MTIYKSFASDVDAAALDIKFKKRDYKWKKKLNIHRENHALKIALRNNTQKRDIYAHTRNQFDFILNSLRISFTFVYSECTDRLSSCIIHALPSESLYLRWDCDSLIHFYWVGFASEKKSEMICEFYLKVLKHASLKCLH